MKPLFAAIAFLLASVAVPALAQDGTMLAPLFRQEVDRRLEPPLGVQIRYAQWLEAALKNAGIASPASQYFVLADRNPHVQAIFVYWLDAQATANRWHFIGAAPVSTGRPGGFEHFITPTGVFAHTLEHQDYRAEGTLNDLGIRGLGGKGMRVFDFGWALAQRTWGRGGQSPMRLLLHATDPDYLEPQLGKAMSKGCIRIPATLNTFIDRYGVLDAEYEQAMTQGKQFWVLSPQRKPTPWSGRYLIVIDSEASERPAWSPLPAASATKPKPSAQAELEFVC